MPDWKLGVERRFLRFFPLLLPVTIGLIEAWNAGEQQWPGASFNCDFCPGPEQKFAVSFTSATDCAGIPAILHCLGLQVPDGDVAGAITIPFGFNVVYTGPSQLDGTRFEVDHAHVYPSPGPTVIPAPEWLWTAPGTALPWPSVDPLSLPIGQPVPDPAPIPYRAIPGIRPNPMRAPQEQRRSGGDSLPRRQPYTVPGEVWQYDYPPAGRTAPRGSPSSIPIQPPPRGTRERKVIANIPGSHFSAKLINLVTETKDAVDAFWWALPAKFRKGTLLPDRFRDLWQHWDEVDMGKALRNLIRNEITDQVVGRIGRAVSRTYRNNPYWTRPVGVSTGPAM